MSITGMKTVDVAVNDTRDLYDLRSLFCQCSPGISMTDTLTEALCFTKLQKAIDPYVCVIPQVKKIRIRREK